MMAAKIETSVRLLRLGPFQLFLVVFLTVSSNRKKIFKVAVSFKGKNGKFVSSTAFTICFKNHC